MICFPNCKINLGLYITRRREDGYHDLETVFYPLPASPAEASAKARQSLIDVLEVVPSAVAQLHMSGREVAGDSASNLVWKAYQLLKKEYPGKLPDLDIYLYKNIPMGAGLGGGSADGAYMLRLLNDYCQLGATKAQLAAYALQLGSDCPFFIYNRPQLAGGRGEQMTDIDIDLSAYSIQVICPDVHVSTGKAFQMITPRPAPFDLSKLPDIPVAEWKNNIGNDFEEPVFQQHQSLAAIKQQLYDGGALYAAMSGSGSAIFGVFLKGARANMRVDVGFEEYYVPAQ